MVSGYIIWGIVLSLFLIVVGILSIRTLLEEKRQTGEMRKLTMELESQAKKAGSAGKAACSHHSGRTGQEENKVEGWSFQLSCNRKQPYLTWNLRVLVE